LPFLFARRPGAEPSEPRKGSKILEGGDTGRRAIRPAAQAAVRSAPGRNRRSAVLYALLAAAQAFRPARKGV